MIGRCGVLVLDSMVDLTYGIITIHSHHLTLQSGILSHCSGIKKSFQYGAFDDIACTDVILGSEYSIRECMGDISNLNSKLLINISF